MGNSDGAAPASGGTTQNSSVLRDRTRPLGVARLELERDDGDRLRRAGGERNRRRLDAERGFAALIAEAPHKSRARRRLGGAGESHGNLEPLAGANRGARRPRDDEPGPLQFGQPPGESARVVQNVHEAVRFPLRVVKLGDDIAGDRRLPAQRLDLLFERAILKRLRRARQSRRGRRRSPQAPRRESAFRSHADKRRRGSSRARSRTTRARFRPPPGSRADAAAPRRRTPSR